MRKGLKLCTIFICGVLAAATTTAAAAADVQKRTVTTEATYSADSVEAQQIQRWLVENTLQKRNGEAVGSPHVLGDIRVTITAAETEMRPMVIDAPPVPLPGSGNPGDKISITSSNSRYSETWSYQWVGSKNGSWVLISYHFDTLVR